MRKILIFLLSLIIFTSYAYSQDGSDNISIKALMAESSIESVQIKSVGSSGDVMLEGTVSSNASRDKLKQLASKYFNQVFDVLTVTPPNFDYQFFAYLVPKTINDTTGSPYLEVVHDGIGQKKPWFFFLYDDKEVEEFKVALEENAGASAIGISSSGGRKNAPYWASAKIEKGNLETIVKAENLDNGFIKVNVSIDENIEKSVAVYGKDIYCRKGEWIALTGFYAIEEKTVLFLFRAKS